MKSTKVLPIFMTYMVMGFVDIVGVSLGYIRRDFQISDNLVQTIPLSVFFWFLVLSIPCGILQKRIGKRRMMNAGLLTTALGMFLPFVWYSFPGLLTAFALLGIGNTIIQVAANPLLQTVVAQEKLSGYLSFTQFLKAVTSLFGPLITTFMAIFLHDWKLVFMLYAMLAISNVVWLSNGKTEESGKGNVQSKATFRSSFGLLSSRFIALMAVSILLIVGADVGMNANIQHILITLHNSSLEQASYGISVYFASLLISRFSGAFILQRVQSPIFLTMSVALALCGLLLLYFGNSYPVSLSGIFICGLGAGNFFPLIFSYAIGKMPDKADEISSLMVMAIVGGAIIPPVIGLLNTAFGIEAGLMVFLICFLYILFVSIYLLRQTNSADLPEY